MYTKCLWFGNSHEIPVRPQTLSESESACLYVDRDIRHVLIVGPWVLASIKGLNIGYTILISILHWVLALIQSKMATVGLDIKDIKGPEDYKNYYHTDGLGDIWVDGKGHPIE